MSDIRTRAITALIGLIFISIVLFIGGVILKGAILLVIILAIYEMSRALNLINIKLNIIAIMVGLIGIIGLQNLNLNIFSSLIVVFFVLAITYLFSNKISLVDSGMTILIFYYIPLNLSLLISLDKTPFLYLVFIIAFSTDTFAYLTGSKFGRIKLLESVSPKKSVEGFIGGILGCLICSIFYLIYFNLNLSILSVIFIVLASVMCQIGDLFASKIKRLTGIKDYSNLLPGHGGIMDRIDSIIFIIPLIYSLLNIVNNL
ncbi:phosphatidate cytidylyltransferase [Peptoniphilus indolicus]|nr:phosphatidate cytidylyltransferase [Peptoniphilus indolicus]SUB76119.1 Phosphatidate cytidylyltransferase [Peptoniphilus indolicus]